MPQQPAQPPAGPEGPSGEHVRVRIAPTDQLLQVKQHELTAHRSAMELHEQAAALLERLGHPERAAKARAHAEHARELYGQACEELTQYQARITAARDKAGEAPGRSS